MSIPKPLIVTAEGLEKLKAELVHMKDVRRKEVADRLKDAISYGDLSENSEYQEAKEEQAFLEGKIIELEKQIKNAKVSTSSGKKSGIHLGTKVMLESDGEDLGEFLIVGATEADPFNNKISNESPVGSALLGKKKGDTVLVESPKGTTKYTIQGVK